MGIEGVEGKIEIYIERKRERETKREINTFACMIALPTVNSH